MQRHTRLGFCVRCKIQLYDTTTVGRFVDVVLPKLLLSVILFSHPFCRLLSCLPPEYFVSHLLGTQTMETQGVWIQWKMTQDSMEIRRDYE